MCLPALAHPANVGARVRDSELGKHGGLTSECTVVDADERGVPRWQLTCRVWWLCRPCTVTSQMSKKFGSKTCTRYNFCKSIVRLTGFCSVVGAIVACGLWFLSMAWKLEGDGSVSWVRASIPLWVCFGLMFCGCVCGGIAKPEYGAVMLVCRVVCGTRCRDPLGQSAALCDCRLLQLWLVSLITLLPTLIVRADGKDIKMELALIPIWIFLG